VKLSEEEGESEGREHKKAQERKMKRRDEVAGSLISYEFCQKTATAERLKIIPCRERVISR
jgi:hypothetical protein